MASGAKKRKKKKREGEGERERKEEEEEEEEENECTFFDRSLFNQPLPTFLFLLLSTIFSLPLSLSLSLLVHRKKKRGGYEKADVRRMQMNTVRGNYSTAYF